MKSMVPNYINFLFLGEFGFYVSRVAYTKYVNSFLTPDVLSKFMHANYANKMYNNMKK